MSEKVKYDFGGYVTKSDLKCTDGRTIRHGAFDSCNGTRVPLVYMHNHKELPNVLGFVDLEAREDGVYGRGAFNHSAEGQAAKIRVEHGDLTQMSIYANQLQERDKQVFHGMIREVSLVLAGANPGAVIDNLNLVHADGSFDLIEDECTLVSGLGIEIFHSEDEEEPPEEAAQEELAHADQNAEEDDKTVQDVLDSMSDEQRQAVDVLIGLAVMQENGEDISELASEAPDDVEGPNLKEVLDGMTEEQQNVTYFLLAKAVEEAKKEPEGAEEVAQADNEEDGLYSNEDEGENDMAHMNVFDQTAQEETRKYLSKEDEKAIFHTAMTSGSGSLKDAWMQFAEQNEYDPKSLKHGITNIDVFYPEVQAVSNEPAMISRRMEWVSGVLAAVHKTPFARIKSMAADITEDEARARGYIKGNKKVEEQISALKRITRPTTVYKLQKLDRDDVIDITDFDVVAWLRAEMRVMLEEEIARAYLIGDGRLASSNDKIDESCIRPIWTDDEVYAVHTKVEGETPVEKAKNFIDGAIRARKYYKGSGSPVLYIGGDLLTEMRLIRDELGHRLYKNDQELADEMRVSKIVEIELLDELTREVNETVLQLGGIIVNLGDYNVGTDRGGEVSLFDDFDLNFNKYEYLIETRQSGALVQPKSALVLEFDVTESE